MKKNRYSEEQIIGFLKQAEAGMPVKELCRKGGFSDAAFIAAQNLASSAASARSVLLRASSLCANPLIRAGLRILTSWRNVATLTPHTLNAVGGRITVLTTALKTTDVRSRIEPDLKNRAAEVLAECGLNLSDAIRLFLRQVVAQQGLPFEIRTPNVTTIAAMKEARALGKAKFDSAQALFNDLEKAAPEKARKPAKKQR